MHHTTTIDEAEIGTVSYRDFDRIELVDGFTIYSAALVQSSRRGGDVQPRAPQNVLLIRVDGDPRDREVARRVKAAFGATGPGVVPWGPGRPFGWQV